LENARNWLIIGVWTGARAGDLLNLLTKKSIIILLNMLHKTDQK
jgi:hypothetical protein